MMNLAEAVTSQERVRRAMVTGAEVLQLRATQLQNAFDRLTLELSRADRGRREPVLLACPQVSTKPRDGVGLNDWLGGADAGENEASMNLPNTGARSLGRDRRTFRRWPPKRPYLERAKYPEADHCLRSRHARRMRPVSAHRATTEEETSRRTNRRACRPKPKTCRDEQPRTKCCLPPNA